MSSYATNSAGVSKYTAERHQRILLELLQQPGNDVCADCKSRAPRWSSWNLGIFICVQCASIHRKIGTHVTKVKSVNLDAWTKEQLESVKNMGNIASNAKYNPNEARHPPPTNMEESERDSEMEKYIRAKYETKKFMGQKPAAASISSMSTSAPTATPAPVPTLRKPKPDPEDGRADPSQTVRLGFGRESRVEFSLGPGTGVGDMFDDVIQKVPQRSRTAPIPEPAMKATPPPVPPVPVPAPVPAPAFQSSLPSRSLSAQPPNPMQQPTLGLNTAVAPSAPVNGVWGDMMGLQTVGAPAQASPMQQNNPYSTLSVSPNLPSTLANRMGQTRSFTAPANAIPPNPFFNQAQIGQQQPMPTGSSGSSMLGVPTGGSFGSIGSSPLVPAPTGSSIGSMGSGSFGVGGMGTSPGSAFNTNPFGTSTGSLGVSPGGAFGTSPAAQTTFGASPGAFGTTMLSPTSQQVSSPFQQTTMSPFGGLSSLNTGVSPNTTSLSAFGAAMSPPSAGQASNSPFAQAGNQFASNQSFQATNPAFQPSSTLFQTAGSSQFQANQFQQPAPTGNAFLQPAGSTPFQQQSNSPFQQSNSPFQQSNSPFAQSNSPFAQSNPPFQPTQPAQMGNNPFGTFNAQGGGMGTNPFGQQQAQFQYQGQGWGGM